MFSNESFQIAIQERVLLKSSPFSNRLNEIYFSQTILTILDVMVFSYLRNQLQC